MKHATRFGLLIAVLGPLGSAAAQVPEPNPGALDLRLLREDLPTGGLGGRGGGIWKPAPSAPVGSLPDLGTGAARQGSGNAGQERRGGFRSDLPYGSGYEARQGQSGSQSGSQDMGSGSGYGSGNRSGFGGRGRGGGRGR